MAQETARVGLSEKIGYALGDSASNLYWKTFEFFLVIFYTDVFGISAAAVGTMLLVTRVADAFADPIMGAIADRTKTRWGHFRPYILWGALPLAVAGVLTFTTPNLGGGAKVAYAYVTYGLLMFLYTAVNIPYTALLGVMTPNSIERTALSSLRFIGAFTAAVFVQYSTLSLVKFLGQGNDARGWQLTMIVYGVLAVIMFAFCFGNTRERVNPPEQQETNIWRDLRDLFSSRPWCIIFVVLLLMLASFSIRGGVTTFYFKYYVDVAPFVGWLTQLFGEGSTTLKWLLPIVGTKEALLGWFLVSNGAFGLLGVALTPRVVKRLGKKLVFMLAVGVGGSTYALLWLPGPTNVGWMFVLQIVSSFIVAFNSPIVYAMFADTADRVEWRTGRRATGLVFASALFGLKMGWGLGGWLLAVMLSAFGYLANVEQSAHAITGILLAISIVPAVLLVTAAAFLRLYVLDEPTMVTIEKELKERREAGTQIAPEPLGGFFGLMRVLLGPMLVLLGFVFLILSQLGEIEAGYFMRWTGGLGLFTLSGEGQAAHLVLRWTEGLVAGGLSVGWPALVAIVAGVSTMVKRAKN
jgi:GPH family glycoside/pentoside/hexuronide:cation symporter